MRTTIITFAVLAALAGRAHAWDGPNYWWDAPESMNPGSGGIFGTGGAHDHGITCAHCHVDNDPQQSRIDLTFTFTPPLGSAGGKVTYAPGQRYQVDVALTGEYLGISGCAQYQSHTNNFAATFETDAGQQTVGILETDGTPRLISTSCPTDYPSPPPPATTGIYRDCAVVFGAGPQGETIPGLTAWRFFWTAPAAGTGGVTMYWGGVDGNCDMMSMKDAVKTGKLALADGSMASIAPARPHANGGGGARFALLLLVPAAVIALRRRSGAGLALLIALVTLGASGCGGDAKAAGTLGGNCIAGGVCNAGLMCVANMCVEQTGDGGMTIDSTTGGDGAAADAPRVDASGPDGPVNQPPVVTIYHPGNNETRYESNGAFLFNGVAADPEDGMLVGASLVWTSSIDGVIGTGAPFNYLPSLGTHTITLTATDSGGSAGTSSITLTMMP